MATRKFGPRSKEQRKLRSKKKSSSNNAIEDAANTLEILPAEAAREKLSRRQQLQDELRAAQGQMSSKKKKRLDKYIENKLRKEEGLDLLRKLALQRSDVSGLKSSRTFGAVRQKKSQYRTSNDNEDLGSSDDEPKYESRFSDVKPTAVTKPTETAASFGSGLKRPLEKDETGAPVIRKRQRMPMPTRFGAKNKVTVENYLVNQSSSAHLSEDESEEENSSESSWSGLSDTNGANETAKAQRLAKMPTDNDEGQEDYSDDEESLGLSSGNDSGDSGDVDEEEDDSDDEKAMNLLSSMFDAVKQARATENEILKTSNRDVSGFRDWATQQLNQSKGFTPNRALDEIAAVKASEFGASEAVPFFPRPMEQEELPPELQVPAQSSNRTSHAVLVERSPEIQANRSKLPVVAEEQKIMEAIHNNPVTVVCGATGSGKTTQIPQFLFEAGFGDVNSPTPGMIAVTQPRRVAAVTMAQRVAVELGNHGSKVAYQIRYGSTVSKNTAIKFMTDGILIREIASDFKLTKYSAIVIDEAHERSVNTDILIGILSRIVELRADEHEENPAQYKPLKLIVMSATLMAKAFLDNSRLFRRGIPPFVQSEGRQYPVTMHFAKQTRREYVEEAYSKIMRGHKKLPPGAMLVFLTGENEILDLSRRLCAGLGLSSKPLSSTRVQLAASEAPLETDDFEALYSSRGFETESTDGEEESEEGEFDVEDNEESEKTTDAIILPLHSKLATKNQLKVFEAQPSGTRLIVLATNVAETSITIPGIRYVFDCGRSKEKVYSQGTGVQNFEIGWISKASATQRAGRAGRTGPGHCYRLYSSAVYERDFEEHTEPEILRVPIEGVVLQLKSMDLEHVVNFPFPTSPDRQQIALAEKLLSYLGALDSAGKVTKMGRDLSIFPISPRFAKMLAIGHQQDCMLLTIAMVAALATPELFIPENHFAAQNGQKGDGEVRSNSRMIEEHAHEQKRKDFRRSMALFGALDEYSDAVKLLAAFGAYSSARQNGKEDAFCNRSFLRPKAMKEAYQLFLQLTRIVADNHPGLIDRSATVVPGPSTKQVAALKKIVAVGYIDRVAIRADLLPTPPSLPKAKRATDVAYMTLFPSHEEGESKENRYVYVHPSSVLAQRKTSELPMYVMYSALQRGATKVRMHPLTNVTDTDLAALAKGTPLLEYGKPVGKVEAVPGEPNKRICWVVPSLIGRRGTTGWPLREQKVVQKRVKGEWTVERVAK